jgi:hypothetical protein
MPSAFGISFSTLVLANLCLTIYMTGVIWFVQIVHYPLFADVGAAGFVRYEQRHSSRTSAVVAVPMILELGAAAFLAWLGWSSAFRALTTTLLLLVLAIWASTFLLQVPCHTQLGIGYSETVQRRLVRGNWLRTVAWSLRSLVLIGILAHRLR